MSQGGLINSKGGSGGGNVQTLTGNSGGAVGPTGNNINLVGSGGISIAGNPGTSTLTVTAAGSVPTTFTENTGTATPAANNLNIVGTVNAAGTTPLTTTGAGSTVTISTQFSQAIASTNANNVGLAAFNSSQFTVDANGFVSTSGTGIANTITGNTGGALSPVGGNWNILGTSVPPTGVPVATSGSGNTLNINVQRATATGSSTSATAGLASFNSSQFTVDANGFVTSLITASAAVQEVTSTTSTPTSTVTTMPISTTPQNTDGVQVLTVSITPTSSSHVLIIEYNFWIFFPQITPTNVSAQVVASASALFQDSTAGALYAQLDYYTGIAPVTANTTNYNFGSHVKGRFKLTAGTTSSTTFKLRIGRLASDTSGTLYFLQDPSANKFGGAVQASMTVTEWTS